MAITKTSFHFKTSSLIAVVDVDPSWTSLTSLESVAVVVQIDIDKYANVFLKNRNK